MLTTMVTTISIYAEEEFTLKTLKNIKCGQKAVIQKVEGESALKRRILDMGLTKGSEVYVRKLAPLGDPIEITIRGYELCIRKKDAERIIVE